MSIYDHTAGRAYTHDPDYDQFLGRQYTGIVYDWSIRQWVRCTMQAPKTPRDSVLPADPDAQLQPEQMPQSAPLNHALTQARAAMVSNLEAQHEDMRERVTAYLREHGPTSIKQLHAVVGGGLSAATLRRHLHRWQFSHYQYFGTRDSRWGLVGQTYTPVKQIPTYVPQMCELIRANGPMATTELMAATGKSRPSIIRALLRDYTDIFVQVGQRRFGAGMQPLYGLRGIHDKQEAR